MIDVVLSRKLIVELESCKEKREMEEFSVLKTPAYAKHNGVLSRPQYSERYGYKLAYYEPLFDVDLKIPGMRIAQVPFIPIQHIRSSRESRPFVPRHLTEQDMIQINLRAQQKAKDILSDFHPAQKAPYESARNFQTRKEIESKLESVRESCANAHTYYKKAEKYDTARKSLYTPRIKTRFVEKDRLKDIVLDSHIEHINDMSKGLSEDSKNHRARYRMLSAGCKTDKMNNDEEEKEGSVVPELPDIESTSEVTPRKNSRDHRADQLLILEERLKKRELESECFERTYGRYLNKLRGDVTTLSKHTDDYLADTRYKTFQIDQLLRKF